MKAAAVATKLIIYAYASFTSSWGPGPAIVKKFENICQCRVELVNGGEGGALISRLKLEGEHTDADVVIGLDGTSADKVKTELKWNSELIPYDYGPYAFVYNAEVVKEPPTSLDDLLAPRFTGKIALEDPRLSTTGMGFLLWVIKEKGEDAWSFLKKLKPQTKLVAPSWDLAYGLFKKNNVDLVFSYWSSPAYHIQEEHKQNIKAAIFTKGHYVQTEFLVTAPMSTKKGLQKQFTQFMLTPAAQEELMKKNFMFPMNKETPLTPAFKQIGNVKTLSPLPSSELKIDIWLKKWREIFS